ncbi:acid protease, partial [Eremomyces bilateralis CBS 781.70]
MFQRRRVRRDTVTPAPYVASPSEEWEGNDGSWSTFRIHIGTPGQNFRVLPSTAGSETWVPMPDGCTSRDPEDCPQQRGVELFNGQSSRGFLWNESTTWTETGLYTLDLEASLGYEGHGHYGSDNVTLGSTQDPGTLGLGRQIVAGIADTDYFLGIFGLGIRPVSFSSSASTLSSFLVNAYNQSLIPSLSYGYTAGAPYRLKRVLGNLVLGGYDSSRFNPSLLSFSFAEEDSRALTVGIQSIIASNTLLGVASFTPKGHLSVIDSTVPDIWLPRDACDLMAEAFGLTYDELTELYVINDTMRSKMQQLKPSITFKLGNTAYDNGNSTNIVLPYAAFDLQARWPYYKNPTNYFPIRRAANDSQYTLGRTFLQEAYLIVDHERTNFTVNQATFLDPTSAAQIVTINPINSKSPSSTNLSGGAIGGIVAGAVVLLLAGAIAIWFFRFRK